MPLDKVALGERYVCFECETRFYDLNRPEPTCPSCGVNQREEPEGGKEAAPPPAKAAKEENKAKPEAPKAKADGDAESDELMDALLSKELEDQEEEEDDEEDGGLSELGVPEMGEAEEEADE